MSFSTSNYNKARTYQLLFFMLFLSCSVTLNAQHLELQAETNHSTVAFEISIGGFTKVFGQFNDYTIFMDWDDVNNTIVQLSSMIQVNSIDTGIPARDEHLISADFFDAENYPTISFAASSIQKIGETSYEAKGTLVMHGISREIVLPLTLVKREDNTLGFESALTLNRLDYDIGNEFKHTSMPDFLAKEISVKIYFWTKKRKV